MTKYEAIITPGKINAYDNIYPNLAFLTLNEYQEEPVDGFFVSSERKPPVGTNIEAIIITGTRDDGTLFLYSLYGVKTRNEAYFDIERDEPVEFSFTCGGKEVFTHARKLLYDD